jgi:hypothetical protein
MITSGDDLKQGDTLAAAAAPVLFKFLCYIQAVPIIGDSLSQVRGCRPPRIKKLINVSIDAAQLKPAVDG